MFSIWKISLLFMVTLALKAETIIKGKAPSQLGGWTDVNLNENDTELQKALAVAIREHNKASNDQFISVVSNVIQARKQIVAGVRYALTAQIAQTACRKSDSAPENCTKSELSTLSQHKTCTFFVVLAPWQNKEELQQNSCA
ncbi:cystatin [Microcaecilia unicolor]|uniref:Cystatin-like n=1 Tax=Microcaecilia unicolor TaxID=1415580 RepID=A0A6P7XBH8_9AMPH|nr:cystatin-like [Microcaecilia unicolor]